jgi:toxin ParE1/3/4
MKPLQLHPAARAELNATVAYYERQQRGLGVALLDEVERILTLLPQHPHVGAPYKQTAFRAVPLRRFPYRIFYLELDEQLWMLALAHDRRRPDYWTRRTIP